MDLTKTNQSTPTPRKEAIAPVSIQAWKKTSSNASHNRAAPLHNIENNLNRAAAGKVGSFNAPTADNALSYAPQNKTIVSQKDYEFKDVLDIINPLHHLPVVGNIYRNSTGDDIKPMSRILGGSLFGGPIGAITATANVISEMQTGQDFNDRAFNMMGLSGSTAKAINPDILYRQYQDTDDLRTANWDQSQKTLSQNNQPDFSYYSAITEIELSPMPPRTLIDA